MLLICWGVCYLFYCYFTHKKKANTGYGKKQENNPEIIEPPLFFIAQPKPLWVKDEVIRLKALMKGAGCRKIADAFNRQFQASRQMMVGKTTVANIIRDNQYQIQVLRQKIKHHPPKNVPKQLVWGLDLTYKTDAQHQTHPIFGIIEHHSRKILCLSALTDKASLTLLVCLLKTIQLYGKPKIVRTDNESVFTSKLFRSTLWFLGIKHQTIDKHCPWQNGRIERFFGTLKKKINDYPILSLSLLNQDLQCFQFWYNAVRTHNNLTGKTPNEVWYGQNITTHSFENCLYFNEWGGALSGFYHPS